MKLKDKFEDSIGRIYEVIFLSEDTVTLHRISKRLPNEYLSGSYELNLPVQLFINSIGETWNKTTGN